MYWANFLHFYQPPNQLSDILKRIVNESYRLLIKGLKNNRQAKLTLNLNACLTEVFAKEGYKDVINDLIFLAKRNQIEFTETAKYHPFLPLLPEAEIKRQIKLNHLTNKKYLGNVYQPKGFFSPEMAYSPKIGQIISRLNYQWLIIDEIAFAGEKNKVDFSKTYVLKNHPGTFVYFKNEQASNLIAGAITRSANSFLKELGDDYDRKKYLITAMDGETFGHHRPGLEDFLFELYSSKKLQSIFISEIPQHFTKTVPVNPLASTWSCDQSDLKKHLPYKLWYQPDNQIHRLQWKFLYWSLKNLTDLSAKNGTGYLKARKLLDEALNSCQFWWASKYWWSLEMIEQGAFNFLEAARATKSSKIMKRAGQFYQNILTVAFKWQRDGVIRDFHKKQESWQQQPLKTRTSAEWFNQLILEFEAEMKKAASGQEYEKAIKWRDAVIKLKGGNDVYDVLHVVNELHSARKIPSVQPFLEHRQFSEFAKKYFLPHPYLNKKNGSAKK